MWKRQLAEQLTSVRDGLCIVPKLKYADSFALVVQPTKGEVSAHISLPNGDQVHDMYVPTPQFTLISTCMTKRTV